jgi:hypothetical protein
MSHPAFVCHGVLGLPRSDWGSAGRNVPLAALCLVGAVGRHPADDAALRQSLLVGDEQPGRQFKSSPAEGSSAGTCVVM